MSRTTWTPHAILGDLPDPDELLRAIGRCVTEPETFGDELPAALLIRSMDPWDHALLTFAEAAFVRWREVAAVLESDSLADRLADALRQAGFVAMILKSDGRAFRVIGEAIGHHEAQNLAAMLAGFAFVLPCAPWSGAAAAAIEADCRMQMGGSCGGDWEEWTPCPERLALDDAASKWAKDWAKRGLPK
ncbi:MAG: hypothetical protein NVS9B10_03550 [Nevskia sp.]